MRLANCPNLEFSSRTWRVLSTSSGPPNEPFAVRVYYSTGTHMATSPHHSTPNRTTLENEMHACILTHAQDPLRFARSSDRLRDGHHHHHHHHPPSHIHPKFRTGRTRGPLLFSSPLFSSLLRSYRSPLLSHLLFSPSFFFFFFLFLLYKFLILSKGLRLRLRLQSWSLISIWPFAFWFSGSWALLAWPWPSPLLIGPSTIHHPFRKRYLPSSLVRKRFASLENS